jgi:hypothetical protein
MFRDIGLPEWLVSIDEDNAAQVTAALASIHGDYPLARDKVKRTMAFVDRRSAEMMATLRRVLGTPDSSPAPPAER